MIERMGVAIETNRRLGRDFSLAERLAQLAMRNDDNPNHGPANPNPQTATVIAAG